MKQKILETLTTNKLFFVELVIGVIALGILFMVGLPAFDAVTDWSDNTQAFNALGWTLLPGAVSALMVYLAFKPLILLLLTTGKVMFIIILATSFSLLWNPLPFTSSYYDLWVQHGLSFSDQSPLFVFIGVILFVLAVTLFFIVARSLKTLGTILVLVLSGGLIYFLIGEKYIMSDNYSLIVFTTSWIFLSFGYVYSRVQKMMNTKTSEDSDTED